LRTPYPSKVYNSCYLLGVGGLVGSWIMTWFPNPVSKKI
jgi:hypothetical protein